MSAALPMSRRLPCGAATALLLAIAAPAAAQYDAPAAYYSGVTNQTGQAFKGQLGSIMSSGHVQTNYGQARDYMPITDANPANLTQMFEYYSRTPIQKSSATQQGFIGIYDSREHVWPVSRLGTGDPSNGTTGRSGDIHMLKPLSQSINSSRGNDYFTGAGDVGGYHPVGSSAWFPGAADKGDTARMLFYAATRWESAGLSLVNGAPSGMQMGDLNSLLHWHYQDTPDTFERRRNDVIYRGDDANTAGDDIANWAGTRNRNAYIDRPEYAWSVFADQQNDTQLSVSASHSNVHLGRVLRGAATPAAKNVTLNKAGVDGTYYAVTTAGQATSTVNGRLNAFTIGTSGSRTIGVGLETSTTSAGEKTGTVTIDNLDVTTQGGAGRGANDANDVINVGLSVLDASNSSFAATNSDELTIDFGTFDPGEAAASRSFSLFNVISSFGAALTAGLDLDSIDATGDTDVFDTNLAQFTNLVAGGSRSYLADFSTAALGGFAATYTLTFSDEDLPGTRTESQLTLKLTGAVVPEPATPALVAIAGLGGLFARRRRGGAQRFALKLALRTLGR